MAELSIREFARRREVSHVFILKLIREGKLTRTASGKIDEELADQQWAANRSPMQPSKLADAAVPGVKNAKSATSGYNDARTQREFLKLEAEQLDLQKQKGSLVDVAEVEIAAFNQARAERDALLNWPARIVPLIAAEMKADATALFPIMDRHVREFLSERIEGPLLGQHGTN